MKRPPTTFDGVIWQLDHMPANIGDGAATTDELKNLIEVVRDMAQACARIERAQMSESDRMLAMLRSKP